MLDHAKFDGEPIEAAEFFELFVGRDAGSVADELRKVGKIRVREHRDVADGLMDDVWLGRIRRVRMMADVLRTEHHAVRKPREKAARFDQAFDRSETKAC